MKKNENKPEKENELNSISDGFSERLKIAAINIGGGNTLSRKTGIPRGTLERYLNGQTEPKISQLILIAEVTNMSPQWLLTGQGEPEAVKGMDGETVKQQRLAAILSSSNISAEDPILSDPAMVELMATRRITPQIVEDAVRLFLEHILENNETIHPESVGGAVSILCQMGADEGRVTKQTVERLMKIRQKA